MVLVFIQLSSYTLYVLNFNTYFNSVLKTFSAEFLAVKIKSIKRNLIKFMFTGLLGTKC